MNNGTSSSESATRGWTASPDERGTIDIITSCFLTIILCCWTAVCPNIPSLSDTAIDHFRDKLNLACIALLGPDFLFCIAVGQRSSAARSVEVSICLLGANSSLTTNPEIPCEWVCPMDIDSFILCRHGGVPPLYS